jgi:hypothetical protein
MTRDEILALTAGREADAVVALRIIDMAPMRDEYDNLLYWVGSGVPSGNMDDDEYQTVPYYTTCRNAAALVLAEVERRGRIEEFVDDLTDVVGCSMFLPEWHHEEAWLFLNATPLQLSQAALLATGGAK